MHFPPGPTINHYTAPKRDIFKCPHFDQGRIETIFDSQDKSAGKLKPFKPIPAPYPFTGSKKSMVGSGT
jgi:hypothetical protein